MSKAPLMSLEAALEQVLSQARASVMESVTVSTFDALGRVLSAPLTSPLDVPAQDNTSMDGYAILSEDLARLGTRGQGAQGDSAHTGGCYR